ncbi:MAG: hypothetical protein ACM3PT_01905 [Deltaproteobacteria bacterium]
MIIDNLEWIMENGELRIDNGEFISVDSCLLNSYKSNIINPISVKIRQISVIRVLIN